MTLFDTIAMYLGYMLMLVMASAAIMLVTYGIGECLNDWLNSQVKLVKNLYWFIVFRRIQRRIKRKHSKKEQL